MKHYKSAGFLVIFRVSSPPIKNLLATVLIQLLESQKHRQFQLTFSHKQGRIQPVSVGGKAISVIFGSQVSLRIHYCKTDEVYFTVHCCDKALDSKIALSRKHCFPNCKKSSWK